MLRAARDACKGRVIAVAQPHRFTRLRDLFDEFCRLLQRCRHGDRRAGLCGRRSADRRRQFGSAGGADPRPAAIATPATSRGRRRSRRSSREMAKPGDFVVFLGAGTITQWAYALPKRTRRGVGMNRSAALFARLGDSSAASAAASRRTPRWTRSPGSAPAAWPSAVPAGRRRTILRRSCKAVPDDVPVTVVGVGSNLLVRDGGIPGVVVRLSAKGFGEAQVMSPTPHPRRRGHARQARRRVRAGGRHRRLPFLPRHSRRHRRRAAHECRRQRRRDARARRRGPRARPQGQASTCFPMPTWATPTAIRRRRRT